jgi:hypothetical protein
MAAESGYNPNNIANFTKITDLNQLEPGKNYLVKFYWGKPMAYHIAKFIEMKEDDRKPTYFFHSLYTKSRFPNSRWIKKDDDGYVPNGIDFDNETLHINQENLSTNPDPNDSSKYYNYSIYELGPYGNLISELLRPEDVYSNVRGHTLKIIGPKTKPNTTKSIMEYAGKFGGKTKTKRKRKIKRVKRVKRETKNIRKNSRRRK